MFDTQNNNQLRSPDTALASLQKQTGAEIVVSVTPHATPLPAPDPAYVIALLAWAVRTAAVFLDHEAGHGAPALQESEEPSHELWPTGAGEPKWFFTRARRPKISHLCLGKHDRGRSARHSLPTAQALSTPSSAMNAYQFDGRRWVLRFAGTTVTQRNLKGWRYLTFLLQRPHEEVHVLDLLQLTDARPRPVHAGLTAASTDRLAAQGLRAARGLDECVIIDAAARAAYRRRWVELQGELADAERWNDPARVAAVRAEADFLAAELATGYGARRHSRSASETAEKARKAVTNRMRDAIAKLQDAHPALWQHLVTSLKTGTFCSYQPAHPTWWVG